MKTKIFFICDKKACGKKCPNADCFYTSNRKHAKHNLNGIKGFVNIPTHHCVYFFEKEKEVQF